MEKTHTIFSKNEKTVVSLFFLVPTFMLIIGYFLNPYPPSTLTQQILYIPLFLGLIFLGIGFFSKKQNTSQLWKISGWITFSFYWATQPSFLYFSEGGDVFNAAVCIIGIYVLTYCAYHEWLSIQRKESVSSLNWIAGGTFFAGIIYFTIDSGIFPWIKNGLIESVAAQTTWLLQFFGSHVQREGSVIIYDATPITIIFACTAIQALVVFVGMNGALKTISFKRKLGVIALTGVIIYVLNLVRNVSVIYLVGSGITSFNIAHNYLAKAGALITLIALLLVNFKLVPQLYDEINGIIDLPKRNGPVEVFLKRFVGKKTNDAR